MNKLTQTLLGGAALGALIVVPAVAGHTPGVHVQALHAGKQVNKTKRYGPQLGHITYTIGVSSYIAASAFHKTVSLVQTFYKWNAYSGYSCDNSDLRPAKDKLKVQRKSVYGEVRAATETYSFGCVFGPSTFYGDNYKLTNKSGFGQTDQFRSTLIGKFHNGHGKYRGELNIDVSVPIGTE